MSNRIHILLFILYMCIFVGYQIERKDRIAAETELKTAVNEATQEAFGDCQRIMAMNNFMTKVNTCYQTVETMCSGQKLCLEYYTPMCISDER